MSDEQTNAYISTMFTIIAVGLLVSVYFWISSCQRTELIKSCLQYIPENQNAECFARIK